MINLIIDRLEEFNPQSRNFKTNVVDLWAVSITVLEEKSHLPYCGIQIYDYITSLQSLQLDTSDYDFYKIIELKTDTIKMLKNFSEIYYSDIYNQSSNGSKFINKVKFITVHDKLGLDLYLLEQKYISFFQSEPKCLSVNKHGRLEDFWCNYSLRKDKPLPFIIKNEFEQIVNMWKVEYQNILKTIYLDFSLSNQ